MKKIGEILPHIKEPKNIVIIPHLKPDADGMGASLALYHYLGQLGHACTVISPTNWAAWLNWMPACDKVIDYELNKEKADQVLDKADFIFCVDFNNMKRTKSMMPKLASLKKTRILMDHHQQHDTMTFDYGISDPDKSSTCEMVYDFILECGDSRLINAPIIDCIYAGVVADTGSFKFSSTSASVHRLVADLKERGLEHMHVHHELFDNFLENRLRFVAHVLMNRMEVMYEYNTVLLKVSKADLLKYQIKTGDTEGLVNYPQSIQGMKLVAIVIDRDEERKWSFRSKGDFDCNSFARKYFNGGGHFNASGGHSSLSLDETINDFYKAIKESKSLLQ